MNYKHGLRHTPEYNTWCHIRSRCNNKSDNRYKYYGGRGIKVCEEWNNSFDTFYNDMGIRPSTKHSLDRIENDKGYHKENCRWATVKEQQRNKRSNITFCFNGEIKTLGEWSELLEIPYRVLRDRLTRYKWTTQEAFSTPLKRDNRYLHFRWK